MPTVWQAQKKPGSPGLLDDPEGTPITACGAVKSFPAARNRALIRKFQTIAHWRTGGLGRAKVWGHLTR
jgi:hypothetical protein